MLQAGAGGGDVNSHSLVRGTLMIDKTIPGASRFLPHYALRDLINSAVPPAQPAANFLTRTPSHVYVFTAGIRINVHLHRQDSKPYPIIDGDEPLALLHAKFGGKSMADEEQEGLMRFPSCD